jgi:hypothetical protein
MRWSRRSEPGDRTGPTEVATENEKDDEAEVMSPLKRKNTTSSIDKSVETSGAGRQLFQEETSDDRKSTRKRKPRRSGVNSFATPDLNMPVWDAEMVVPVGLVSSRVNQIAGSHQNDTDVSDEMSKK